MVGVVTTDDGEVWAIRDAEVALADWKAGRPVVARLEGNGMKVRIEADRVKDVRVA